MFPNRAIDRIPKAVHVDHDGAPATTGWSPDDNRSSSGVDAHLGRPQLQPYHASVKFNAMEMRNVSLWLGSTR